MADIRLDLAELRGIAVSARTIAGELQGAERIADETATYTGHAPLAAKVREFGGSWDVTRERITEGLHLISDSLQSIAETFEDLDTSLAQSAAGSGS